MVHKAIDSQHPRVLRHREMSTHVVLICWCNRRLQRFKRRFGIERLGRDEHQSRLFWGRNAHRCKPALLTIRYAPTSARHVPAIEGCPEYPAFRGPDLSLK